MSQTTIQNTNAIRTGSAKVQVGASLGSLTDIGALRGISFKQKGTTDSIKFDNVEDITKFSDGNVFSISASLCEINWSNIQVMNDGQVNISNTPATPVAVTAEAHGTGWVVGSPIKINNKNGDNTIVTSIVVKAGAPTLVSGTDYTTYVSDGSNGVAGYTYVVPLTAQTLAITFGYSYTPTASKTITFNATGKKIGKFITITNTNENGKNLVITMSGVTNLTPLEVNFASDNEANISEMPIELEGTIVSIVDEQA